MRKKLSQKIDNIISKSVIELANLQSKDGHFIFELEADVTIPAEYILLNHYLGTIEDTIEHKLANYLRAIQGDDGGWPLYSLGETNISASVKAYYALKLVGDTENLPHMRLACSRIRALGGASCCNVFTRITLALFRQIPWRAVPVMRVEAMLLPSWFPFHTDKVSYWSRTVMIPLLILYSLRPQACNPRQVGIEELFVEPSNSIRRYHVNPTGYVLGNLFIILDRIARFVEPLLPSMLERRAMTTALSFIIKRLNDTDGLGGIFPAIANAVMALNAIGYPFNQSWYKIARCAVDKLLVMRNQLAYCQPCLSPVWDTALACHALMEVGESSTKQAVIKACTWLSQKQILDIAGDWSRERPRVYPGGWAFQYYNPYYPDVDDTAVVIMALDKAKHTHRLGLGDSYFCNISRGVEWINGMQCRNGGWASFDSENEYYHLNHIPFADHGALLDPPTADVSARCLSMLGQLNKNCSQSEEEIQGLNWLRHQQEPDGSWFGRWGTNYIYGTWSALSAFSAFGEDLSSPCIRHAVTYLKSRQRFDGGWGEDCASYWVHYRMEVKESTPSQTSWALLGLMAAGEVESKEVEDGIRYLLTCSYINRKWEEKFFTAVGFPRIFYLLYHGYASYFPLWTLARYRNLTHQSSYIARSGI